MLNIINCCKLIAVSFIVFCLPKSGYSDDVPVSKIRTIAEKDIDKGEKGRKLWVKEKNNSSPGYIFVKSSGLAWIYKHPPYTGRGHGDGVASFKLSGLVVDLSLKPVKGAKFIELPTRQFGGVEKETERATTKKDGSFTFKTLVGASLSMGKYENDVYQSGLKTFVVKCEGYHPIKVTIGYGCPNLLIQLSSERAKQSVKESAEQ